MAVACYLLHQLVMAKALALKGPLLLLLLVYSESIECNNFHIKLNVRPSKNLQKDGKLLRILTSQPYVVRRMLSPPAIHFI